MKKIITSVYRQWLRFTLCEPEEWSEIKHSRPTSGDMWMSDAGLTWVKRRNKYELAFGPWDEAHKSKIQ